MSSMNAFDHTPKTNWPSVILSSLIPITIAFSFVDIAIQPPGEVSETWLWGMAFFLPLEFVRAFISFMLGYIYENSKSPGQAVKSFLTSIGVLLLCALLWLVLESGVKDAFLFLTYPPVLQVLGLPLLIVVIDSVIGFLMFRGDPQFEAARLEAIYEDSLQLLGLFLTRLPLVIVPIYGLLVWMRSTDFEFMAWFPSPTVELLRRAGFLYVSAYFLAKAAVVANVSTARFFRSHQRLLNVGWIQRIIYLRWRSE